MFRNNRSFARLAALATIALAVVLATAGQAAAMRPEPGPTGPGSVYTAATHPSAVLVTHNSLSVLQWMLFAAALVVALVAGVVLARIAQRRSLQPTH